MVERWDRRSAAEHQRIQRRLLAEWLPHATAFAPHWADQAATAGMAPGEVTTLGDLRRITPTIQGDVASRGGAGLVQRPTDQQLGSLVERSLLTRLGLRPRGDARRRRRSLLLETFKPIHVTRGGIDEQLVVASSRADLRRSLEVGGRAASVLGLTDHDHLVSAVPAGPTAAFWRVQALALGSAMLALHPRGHGDGLDRCVSAFSLVPATAVACLPEDAVRWAQVLGEADADVSRVVFVLLFGPPGDEEHRAAVAAAWRAAGAQESELVVRHVWSPDVHRGVWAECRSGTDGLHTMPDVEHLEVLDPASAHRSEAGGDLAVTSLGWRGTTLLRYRTGVRVAALATVPCPSCRRTLPRVVGPVEEAAWHLRLRADGRVAWFDTRAIEDAVGGLAGIDQWQVVVREHGGHDGYDVEVAGLAGAADRLASRIGELTGVAPGGVHAVAAGELAAAVAADGRVVDRR